MDIIGDYPSRKPCWLWKLVGTTLPDELTGFFVITREADQVSSPIRGFRSTGSNRPFGHYLDQTGPITLGSMNVFNHALGVNLKTIDG